MKIIKDSKYIFLISKIKKIRQILDTESPPEEDVHEAVIDFVLVFECVLKKTLYKKNKLLIYDLSLSNIDRINDVLRVQNRGIKTITALEAFSRCLKIFPRSKFSKHGKSVEILIKNRDELQHNIDIRNIQSKDELLGILADVFPAFLVEAEKVLGSLPPPAKVKKEKTYSETNIQNIYEKIVLSKIDNYNASPFLIINKNIDLTPTGYLWGAETCPRCLAHSLSKKSQSNSVIFNFRSLRDDADLYVCSSCNLELTNLEYEAVQKLKNEGKIKGGLWG